MIVVSDLQGCFFGCWLKGALPTRSEPAFFMPFLYEKTAPWTAPFRKGKMDEKTCLSERLCRGKGGKPAEMGFVLTGDGRSPC